MGLAAIVRKTYLLLLPQSKETDTRHLDDLETNTGNITLGLTTATEARDKDLVVLVDEVQATIILHVKMSVLSSGWAGLDRPRAG